MTGSEHPDETYRWVLLADDSAPLRTLLRRALTAAGVRGEIVDAADATGALREVTARGCPALIVLDLNMPGRSGLDILPEVRRRCPDTFIAVLSGLRPDEAEQASLAGGADLFLSKDRGLAASLRSLLGHWRADRRTVTAGGVPGWVRLAPA